MKEASVATPTRREELLARCQRERYELVAATAAAKASHPRTLRMAHWIRAVSRLLRAFSASMHPR